MIGAELKPFDHLLALADQITSSSVHDGPRQDLGSEEAELILRYCEEFDEWFAVSKPILSEVTDQGQISKLLLLQSKHHSLVDRVKELMRQTSSELSKLKTKGKAILTYTDFLPKRMSTIPPRKG
ncbi:MAG: hypothetical protein DCC75_02355 [Proteobacteria bacterium]|nr:MAG: hypothetical protein DCC75_02355 [Pseudomonadota bacterium]